jgi:hypothetical protein
MAKKTKTAELDIPDTLAGEIEQLDQLHDDIMNAPVNDKSSKADTETESTDAPPPEKELTQDEQNAAYKRKDQVLRDALTEQNNLEDLHAAAKREAKSYEKPIAEAKAKVARLISCDVSGFLRWEKEQELPLLRKAEEAANAWRSEPVDKLDVTEKDREHLAEHFVTCGSVADWLCKDFPDKKSGLNGEKTKDRLRDAIEKISSRGERST